MKKILTYAIITIALLGFCAAVAVNVQAKGGDRFASPVIQKLAERFNLSAEEVQQVFDEARDEMRQEMQARFEERIGDRVGGMPGSDSLTDEQKQALSAKREEFREKLGALKDLSSGERQTKIEELKAELEVWAEENGIGSEMLFGFGFGRGFRGGRFGPCKGFAPQDDVNL